jgi:hypothetical protein
MRSVGVLVEFSLLYRCGLPRVARSVRVDSRLSTTRGITCTKTEHACGSKFHHSFMTRRPALTNRRVKRKHQRSQADTSEHGQVATEEDSQAKKVKWDSATQPGTKETGTGRESSTPEPAHICLSATCSG